MRKIQARATWGLLFVVLISSRSLEQSESDPSTRWNEFFARADLQDARWQPNALLVEIVHEREPGRALDIGMGQGRNALYLAEHGWRVTGIDISSEGVRLTQLQARERGLQIDARVADAQKFEIGIERWDLIVCSYIHELALTRADDIVAALAPGGVLVIEGFVQGDEVAALGHRDLGVPSGVLSVAFESLDVLRDEEVRTRPDWAPDEVLPVARFVAQKR
jgi:SAM-dependent methyltransferase